MRRQFTWDGEKAREFQLCRPCECGCDGRDGYHGVGYLTGSDANGKGFTLWIENEEVYQAVKNHIENKPANPLDNHCDMVYTENEDRY